MNMDWGQILISGVKIVSALAAAAAVFVGLGKVFKGEKSSNNNDKNEYCECGKENNDCDGDCNTSNEFISTDNQSQPNKVQKVVGGIKVVQLVCAGIVSVIGSLGSLFKNLSDLFNKNQYNEAMGRPKSIEGDNINYSPTIVENGNTLRFIDERTVEFGYGQ